MAASTSWQRWGSILGGGIIVVAAVAVYWNSFGVPFLMDDLASITENPTIRHLWPIGATLSPSATSMVGGRPVVNLSLALNYALGGFGVWGYHAFNLAIHILAGLTLFGVVRRTLLRPALRERFGAAAQGLALAVAVLWTVHPLQTEAVTYISQRCELLMGFFYLLTMYCFIRGVDSQRSGWWFTGCVMACVLGMASKEVMMTAPVMVLLYDRTFVSGGFWEAWRRHGRLYLALACSWALVGYLSVGLHYRGVGYGYGIPWWANVLVESRAVVHYLRLTVWPEPLVFDYGDDVAIWHGWHVANTVPYAVMVAILAVGVLLELRRQPAVGFVGAWCLVILAPVSSIVPVVGQPMAEHRMYLPLAAVVTLVVMVIHDRLGRRGGMVFVALAAGLGFLTIERNQDYRSELSIWSDTVAKQPDNPRAHYNLGTLLFQQGKVPEAIAEFQLAVQLSPDYTDAHYNLGLALARVGRLEEAVGQWEQALRTRPDYGEAHVNLGLAMVKMGRPDEAIGHYEEALRLRPDDVRAHYNLAVILEKAGRVAEAKAQYEEALRLRPELTQARDALARLQGGQ